MSLVKTITLFGSSAAKEYGKGILENQPFIRRVDVLSSPSVLRLFLLEYVSDEQLLALLKTTSLSAVIIE